MKISEVIDYLIGIKDTFGDITIRTEFKEPIKKVRVKFYRQSESGNIEDSIFIPYCVIL